MKCPECGIELNDDAVFCKGCGAEILSAAELPEQPAESADDKKEKKTKKTRKPKKAAEMSAAEKKARRLLMLKLAGAAVILVIIVIVIIAVSASVKAGRGRKLFDKVPLGRDITIVRSETGATFGAADSSAYGVLNHIADYDFLCESEDSVEVGGLHVPEWAVALNTAGDGTVNKAVLYNFNAIDHNWMGDKTAAEIDLAVIKFGEKIKPVERQLGLKPYTIIKEIQTNTSVYVYRYHFTESGSGNTIVNNLYVTVDDATGEVTFTETKQVDYMSLILNS